MSVGDLVSNDYIVANPDQDISFFKDALLSGKPVVVKEQDVFLGLLTLRDLAFNHKSLIKDVLPKKPFVKSDDEIHQVLEYMIEYNHDFLPSKKGYEFEGIISQKALMLDILTSSVDQNALQLKKELVVKNKFLSIIGHDIKNMFNQVLGSMEVLDKKLLKLNDEKSQVILKLARRSAEQVSAAFDGMLLWARLGTGQLPFTPEILSLREQFTRIVSQYQLAGDVKGITILNKLEEDLDIYADRNMLNCILLNLVYNAIKFTPSGGEIWLNAKTNKDKTEVVVVDSGLGMSKQQRELLFTKGQATPGTLNEIGTGIGLIICKEFVEKHMGKIEIESEQGKGTRVIVSIPNSYRVYE